MIGLVVVAGCSVGIGLQETLPFFSPVVFVVPVLVIPSLTHGHLVESVTLRGDGGKTVKLYSAQRAAELIGKSLGMFRGDAEQVQLTVILDR